VAGAEDGVAGVGDVETDGATVDAAGFERAGAAGPDVGAAAALCPVSVTASAIAVPATASVPTPAAAPERKLISSMRE
jgi:hypothetical protein